MDHSRALIAALVIAASSPAQPGPRTGMIVGQVIDATSGTPVEDAIVRLVARGAADSVVTTRVMVDGDGRFFFAELAAGDYFLEATKEGYAPGRYGQRRAYGQSGRLSIGEGERATDVTLRVWKYGAIAGTVVDEAGEPLVGIVVRALPRNVIAGRTLFGNMEVIPELVPAAITDDRGMFRLSQLTPGTYVVVVPSAHTTLSAGDLVAPDPALRSNLFFSGVSEMTPLGQPRTQQIGDAALMTPSRVPIPPPAAGNGAMQMYKPTYFPAATTAAGATPIAIAAGEERTDVTLALRPVPAVRIFGRVIAADGSPAAFTSIRLAGESMAGVVSAPGSMGPAFVGLETATSVSDAAGRFTFAGVPSGDYVLTQADAFLSRSLRDGNPAWWFAQPLTVGAEDLRVTVQARPALRVEGRMEFRSGKTPPTPPSAIAGIMFETPFGESGGFAVPATREAGHPFATLAPGGRYIARPYEINGWFVESITAAGKDITDRVFDLQADLTSIVVVFTDRAAKVSGTVTDAQGAANASATVLAFPVDRRQWTGHGATPRTLKSALTSRTGVYAFEHLPPGDYHLIAVDGADADGWQDPSRLDMLAPQANRVTVRTDTARTVDLQLQSIR
jgi:hypothetical protein